VVSLALCDASCDHAHALLAHKLDAHTGPGIRTLEVIDQLRQIFNGVDVVVRWWRHQTNASRAVAALCNVGIDFPASQLATFSRLCTLCHLDLDLLGVCEVLCRHTEAAGSHLLDGRAGRTTVLHNFKALRIFTALSSVRLAAQPVHCNGQRGMCLHGNRAVGHGACSEALDDCGCRLDLFQWDCLHVVFLWLAEV